jgi:hypothetical protein
LGGYEEHKFAQKPKVVVEERQVLCAYDSMPSGQRIPKIFRPKGVSAVFIMP